MNDTQMGMVVTARLLCKEGLEDEFAERLQDFQKTIAHHEGLLRHALHRSRTNRRLFFFFEQYVSEASYERHRTSEELRAWAPIRDHYVEDRLVETWAQMQHVGED